MVTSTIFSFLQKASLTSFANRRATLLQIILFFNYFPLLSSLLHLTLCSRTFQMKFSKIHIIPPENQLELHFSVSQTIKKLKYESEILKIILPLIEACLTCKADKIRINKVFKSISNAPLFNAKDNTLQLLFIKIPILPTVLLMKFFNTYLN